MTVASEVCSADLTWTTNETLLSPGFPAEKPDDVQVFFTANTPSLPVQLVRGVHYAVDWVDSDAPVVLRPLLMPQAPGVLSIQRRTPATQEIEFSNLRKFDNAVHTKLHDRSAWRDAELWRAVARVQTPIADLEALRDQAQNAAALATEASNDAVIARDAAVSAAGQSLLVFKSRAVMSALPIPAGVTRAYVQGRAVAGGGGFGNYVRVNGMPVHSARVRSLDRYMADGVTLDNANGGWWEYDRDEELTLSAVGDLQIDAATDTATMQAWADCLSVGYRPARAPKKALKIMGQVAFTNLSASTRLDFTDLTLSQQQRFMQMVYFDASNASPTVVGGTFRGYAWKEMSADPATRPSEYCYDATLGVFDPDNPDVTYNTESGAFIGVSAITAFGCGTLTVLGGDYRGFAGVGIYATNCNTVIRDPFYQGLGSDWVKPGHQGAHMFAFASWSGTDHVDWDRVHEWTGFDCYGGSFVGLVAACRFVCHSHRRLNALGQHIWYVIEADSVNMHSFDVAYAPVHGIKITFDNYAGKFGGVAYDGGLAVTPGFLVRRPLQKDLWVATDTFVTDDFDTELAANKWKISPLMQRRGGSIHDIQFSGCGYGISGVVNSDDYANNEFAEGMIIHDIKVRDGAVGMHLERFGKNTLVHSCDIDGMSATGIELVDFGGVIRDTRVANTAKSGIAGYIAEDSRLERVTLEDCGLLGETTGDKIPLIIANRVPATSRPNANTAPALKVLGCEINYSAGDAPVSNLMLLDTSIQATVEWLRTTDTQATLNVAGTLVRGRWNDRPFTAGAQNVMPVALGAFTLPETFDPETAGTSEFRNTIAAILKQLQDVHLIAADPAA